MDFRLKGLSIEFKNAQNEIRTRKLWSFEVGDAELIPHTSSAIRGQLGHKKARPEEVSSATRELGQKSSATHSSSSQTLPSKKAITWAVEVQFG